MRRRWIAKNVDLEILSKHIEEFLISQGFETRRDVLTNGCSVQASPRNVPDVQDNITIKLLGVPNDFEIMFLSGERTRSSIFFGYITTILGGGNLVVRGLKSQEALRKLEKVFWMSLEETITRLINTT